MSRKTLHTTLRFTPSVTPKPVSRSPGGVLRSVGFRTTAQLAVVVLLASIFTVASSQPLVAAASTSFSISTNPPMVPSFKASIYDYVVSCSNNATTNLVTTGSGREIIAGEVFSHGENLNVPLAVNQSIEVDHGTASYFIRCLPSDFPAYTAVVTGHPQANGYLVTIGAYVVAFDNVGVPVWWFREPNSTGSLHPNDANFINPTTISWASHSDPDYQLRGLDGSLQGIVGGGAVPLNNHDMQLLPNGNYLAIQYLTRNCPADPSQCVDLSSWGLSSQATVIDCVIVEINAADQILWSWSGVDHINVAAENTTFRSDFPDVIHGNSIQYDGNGGIIFSARDLDAVYRIDMATGAITWKLGGTTTPQSLTMVSSKYPTNFSGQHFARLLPNGDLTVHDNGTDVRPPRAVELTLNLSQRTATIIQQVTDSRTPGSICCGSAIKLSTGNWVVTWGDNDYLTELTSKGVPQITITWPGTFSYRAELLDASISALRQGMNAMVAPLSLTAASTVPNAPASVVATPNGDGTGQVTFAAPAANGSAITGYTVTVADAYNASDPSNGSKFTGTGSPIAISGLNLADTYWVTVTATNGVGTSAGGSSPPFVAADVGLQSLTAKPKSVVSGANVTYTATVANAGGVEATGVSLTDTLPTGLTFVSAQPSQGTCSFAAPTLTCALGQVPTAATATVTVNVTVIAAAGSTITDTATVSATTGDTIPGNDTEKVKIKVT
jgi:uncharacterized repeat protein (TIGR01451 family)